MRTQVIGVRTGHEETVHDLTADCERFLAEQAPGADGLLHVFAPHATVGVALIETGAGSDDDLLDILHQLLPTDHPWSHRHGSPGHGRDHVLPAFIAPSLSVPVLDGRPALGTWQRICLIDTNRDNRDRKVRLSFLTGG